MGRPLAIILAVALAVFLPKAVHAQTVTTVEPLDEEDRPESGEPPSGAPLWLALTGQLALGTGGTQDGFIVALGGSFERLAGPRKLHPPRRAERPSSDDSFDSFEDPADTPVRPKHQIALASDTEMAEASVAHVADGEFARGLVRAALRASKQDRKRAGLDTLAARARGSAMLPEVRFRVGRNLDQAIALVPSATDPTRMTATDGAKLLVEGRATFKLDRLVFADEEVPIEKLRIERERMEKSLVEEILRDLAAWQRAELASHDPTTPPDAAIDNEVARLSAAEALDVLSDGWFSAHAAALHAARATNLPHAPVSETQEATAANTSPVEAPPFPFSHREKERGAGGVRKGVPLARLAKFPPIKEPPEEGEVSPRPVR